MRGRSKQWFWAVSLTLATLMVMVVAILVVAAYRPLPLGFLHQFIEARIERHIKPLRVSAVSLFVQWQPADFSVILLAERLSLTDQQGRKLATLPKGKVKLALGSIFSGEPQVTELHLERPSFAIARMVDGAIQVELGAPDQSLEHPSFSVGSLHELAGWLRCCDATKYPVVTIDDGVVSYIDRATGVRLQFGDLHFDLQPGSDSTPARFSFVQLIGDQSLHFSAWLEQDNAAGTFTLVLLPQDVYPAILGEALPHSSFLKPFEVPISGVVKVRFDKDQALLGVAFELAGGSGSLEVAEYTASNLYVDSLEMRGNYNIADRKLEITSGRIDLVDGQVKLSGSLEETGDTYHLSLEARLSGVELSQLLPRWFTGLYATLNGGVANRNDRPRAEPTATQPMVAQPAETHLVLQGTIQPSNRSIESIGTIRRWTPDMPGISAVPAELQDADSLGFRLDGPLAGPRLMIQAPTP